MLYCVQTGSSAHKRVPNVYIEVGSGARSYSKIPSV